MVTRLARGSNAALIIIWASPFAQQASLDEAIASFRRGLELKPDDSEMLNNLGLALLQQDKANDAIVIFQRALEVRPDDVQARHNLQRALGE